jgi:hypothetical protein
MGTEHTKNLETEMAREIESGGLDDMLDPHRKDEIASAGLEVAGRLHQKGLTGLSGDEDPAQLADLLSAVERFEAAVINRGGDPMINMPGTDEPQDPAFVLPEQRADDSLELYTRRINEAAEMLETPRSIS